MATQVGNVIFQISADLKNIQGQLRTLESSFQSSFNKISSAAQSVAGTLGIGLGIGALVNYGKELVAMGSRLQYLAQQTGFAASTLSGFKTVLEQNGTTVDSFAHAMFNMQRRIGDIDKTTDPLIQSIKDLGLSFEDLRTSTPEDAAQKVVEALAKIPDQTERVRLGYALMGRQFREFIPSVEELAVKWNELKKTGLSDDQIRRLDELDDRWTKFSNTMKFAVADALLNTASYFDSIGEAIDKSGAKMREWMRSITTFEPPFWLKAWLAKTQPGDIDILTFGAPPGHPQEHEPAPAARGRGRALTDPEMEKKVKSLTESLNKQIQALELESLRFNEGAEAAKRFELEQQVINAVGEKNLESYRAQIEAAVSADAVNRQREESAKRAAAGEKERASLLELTLKIEKALKEEEEELIRQRQAAIPSQVQSAELELERLQERLGNTPTMKTVDPLLQSYEQLFDSITGGMSKTVEGVMLGTQKIGEAFRRMGQNIALSLAETVLQLGVLNPLKNQLFGNVAGYTPQNTLAGLFGGLFGGSAGAAGSISSVSLGGAFPAVPFMQRGGIVPGRAGQAVPIMAHAGELVIPANQRGNGGVQVIVRGSIRPEPPTLSPREVIQIISNDLDNRGVTMAMIESRQSRR